MQESEMHILQFNSAADNCSFTNLCGVAVHATGSTFVEAPCMIHEKPEVVVPQLDGAVNLAPDSVL